MKWDSLDSEPCPIARTLAVIGDRWTLLLLRDCFLGIRRFGQFQERLSISRTIIAERLNYLVDHGFLKREPYQHNPVRHEYQLTPQGLSLYPVLLSMAEWGNQHSGMEPRARLRFRHKRCGHSCKPALVCDACGEPVAARDMEASFAPSSPRKPT